MRLSDLKTGQSAVILKVLGHGGFRRRIMEMGFVRGKRVEVLQNAPLKDPIKYKVMEYEVSLRRSEAQMIEVITEEEAQDMALQAESMILMTDIRGLLEDKNNEESLIKKVFVSDIPSLVKQGIISGGMIPKIECCKEAIRRGVKKVFITDGRVNHSILMELLSDEGMGTMFVNGD